jgi:hypothetical protein
MMVGWEGSAHNSRVLGCAMSEDFKIPNGSFYLGDAGYSLGKGMLVPYRGIRYHLRENAQAGQRYVCRFTWSLCLIPMVLD